MGGNALKTVKTRRYERNDFFTLSNKVTNILKPYTNNILIPDGFEDKKDFGDIDIICSFKNMSNDKKYRNKQIAKLIYRLFEFDEIHRNDDVYSFNFGIDKKDFQHDIVDATDYFTPSEFYLRYGDLGNLLGRICYSHGAELGHKVGLCVYYEPQPDLELDRIILSQDYKEILTYIGLDYKIFDNRFKFEKDIFDYVISSPKFIGVLYDWHNLNNENATRNKKRLFYRRFVRLLRNTGLIKENRTNIDVVKLINREKTYENYLYKQELKLKILSDFGKTNELESLIKNYEFKKLISKKFKECNKHIIPYLETKGTQFFNTHSLTKERPPKQFKVFVDSFKGDMLDKWRNSFNDELLSKNIFIDNNSQEQIVQHVINFIDNNYTTYNFDKQIKYMDKHKTKAQELEENKETEQKVGSKYKIVLNKCLEENISRTQIKTWEFNFFEDSNAFSDFIKNNNVEEIVNNIRQT